MEETDRVNASPMPLIMVPTRVAVRMPMTTPRVVRPERSLLARMAAIAMRADSRSSLDRVMGPKRVSMRPWRQKVPRRPADGR